MNRRNRVEFARLDACDAHDVEGAKVHRVRSTEGDRHFPEDFSRFTMSDDALDTLEHLRDLNVAGQDGKEHTLVILVGDVIATLEVQVGRTFE